MDYLQTLCFAGVNSKRRDFQQERREKTAIVAVSVATEHLRKWLKNYVAIIFSMLQHKILKLVDELGHNKRQHVVIGNGKKPTETKISYVAT